MWTVSKPTSPSYLELSADPHTLQRRDQAVLVQIISTLARASDEAAAQPEPVFRRIEDEAGNFPVSVQIDDQAPRNFERSAWSGGFGTGKLSFFALV